MSRKLLPKKIANANANKTENIANIAKNNETLETTEVSKSEEVYFKLSQREHVLERSGMWIGSTENVETPMWIFNDETQKIENKTILYNGGLYKLFCELIENATDHIGRMIKCKEPKKNLVTNIQIEINKETGYISALNDGDGIEVRMIEEHNMYAPQFIFTEMMTGTNFAKKNAKTGKKEEEREGAGMNGLGIKLAIIWSKHAIVETVCVKYGKKYVQHIHNNMSVIDPPTITDLFEGKKKVANNIKPYTKVSFLPDYERFKMGGLTDDLFALMKRRTFEIAGICNDPSIADTKKVKVYWNGQIVPIKTLKDYIQLFPIESKIISEIPKLKEGKEEKEGDEMQTNWEYSVAISPTGTFQHISFVNGINTRNGGEHVDFVMKQIITKLRKYIEEKKKIEVKPEFIKNKLMLFLRVKLINPELLGQTKDALTTPIYAKDHPYHFATDEFIENIANKLGIMKECQEYYANYLNAEQTKKEQKTDGTKTAKIKYDQLFGSYTPANYCGGKQSGKCTLILCEGNSAMSSVESGLKNEDKDYVGVYSLRGKLKNVRDGLTEKDCDKDKKSVIKDLKMILGLKTNFEYTTWEIVAKELNYGKVMILTDADLDGSHIKGLVINFFDTFWPSLVKLDGFLNCMLTPILKATKGKITHSFYFQEEYERWLQTLPNNQKNGWNVIYYKGLGSSSGKEFREYFKNNKTIDYFCETDKCQDAIDMLFSKNRIEERKELIENYDRKNILDSNIKKLSYEQFIKKDLIHFSNYDCERNIANIMDGTKPSQRKILFSAFKRNLTNKIKVSQFSGYVSEHSCYHHGEQSLQTTIISLAQNFVGSNNINLFQPCGQFGTRMQNGDDSASPRYIFTHLSKITRSIYKEEDDNIVNYLYDDEEKIEPEYYLPIIPMVLINNTMGIGTGFSSTILPHNPLQIVDYIRQKLNNILPTMEFMPYYDGFLGTIEKIEDNKYLLKGNYKRINETQIEITELPIDTNVSDYSKLFLQKFEEPVETVVKGKKMTKPSLLKCSKSNCAENSIYILLTFNSKEVLDNLLSKKEKHINEFEKIFKMSITLSANNMYLYDSNLKLRKFKTVEEIIDHFMVRRLQGYVDRKIYVLDKLLQKKIKLENQKRFIEEIRDNTIDIRNKTNDYIDNLLTTRNFAKINDDYDYLLNMPLRNMSKEKIDRIIAEYNEAKEQYDILYSKTEKQLWLEDLDNFVIAYNEFLKDKENEKNGNNDDNEEEKKEVKKIAKKIISKKK
jgi:DNA topoisomerase-2